MKGGNLLSSYTMDLPESKAFRFHFKSPHPIKAVVEFDETDGLELSRA
jgi:hypothetical protein